MAVYQSGMLPPDERAEVSRKAVEALKAAGAVLPPNFRCLGMPQINLSDAVQKDPNAPFDLTPFKGRLVFGGNLNCSDVSAFPSGPVRISIIRWGAQEDQCGKVIVGKTDLDGVSLTSYIGITIGDRCTIGPRCVIMDCDGHPADRRLQDVMEHKKMAPVVIEDDVWIGYSAMIMKGVTVGHHAVVAPGAIVMWNVPPYGVVAGNPAKSVKVYQRHMSPGATPE